MAEVTGADLRSSGLTPKQIAILNFSKLLNLFGRNYKSLFKHKVSGVDDTNSETPVSTGTAKKILAVEPFDLDNLKYGGGEIQVELSLKEVKLNDRIIRAKRYAGLFAIDDKERIDWIFRMLIAINKGFNQGLSVAIDKNISECFSNLLPIIEISNKTTGNRKILAKDTPTIHKTNFVYRDGDWTTSDADQFNHETVSRIHGFFVDRKSGRDVYPNDPYIRINTNVYMQLTPTAHTMLSKTEQGMQMLKDGGVYGSGTSVVFLNTPHDLAAGNFMKNNSNTAYEYVASTDKVRVASRQIKKNNVDNERVLFPVNQTMQATNLNSLNDVAAGSFENIEVDPVDIVAVWAKEAVSFADFTQLKIMKQKNDIRFKNAIFYLRSEGIGSVVTDQNKVMLFPLRGKKL